MLEPVKTYSDTSNDRILANCIIITILNETVFRLALFGVGRLQAFTILYGAITLFVFVVVLVRLAKTNIILFLILEMVLLVYAAFGYYSSANLELLSDSYITCGAVSIPMLCAAHQMQDKSYLVDVLERVSPYVVIVLSLALLLLHDNKSYIDGTAMVLSYCMLLPELLILNKAFSKPKFTRFIIPVFGLVVVFLGGSRGPLLAVIALFVLTLVHWARTARGLLVAIGAFVVLGLMAYYQDAVIEWLLKILNNFGAFYSRTAYFLQEGRISSVGGRDLIWEQYIALIMQKPFFGWGLCVAESIVGINPHNTFIEMASTGGLPALAAYCINVLVGAYYAVLKADESATSRLFKVMFCCMVPFLYIRGYVFTTTTIAVYLGLSLGQFHLSAITPSAVEAEV